MCHLCQHEYSEVKPVYTVFPRTVRSFLDLYRTLMSRFDLELLNERATEIVGTGDGTPIRAAATGLDRDFRSALRNLVFGDDSASDIAQRWISGERVHLNRLRSVGISNRIENSEAATRALSWIVRVLAFNHPRDRLAWMIDEYQRLGDASPKIQSDVQVGLHSAFNECATNFSLVLSFSVRSRQTVERLLSPELVDRARMTPQLSLPPMTSEDAHQFVADLLSAFRPPGEEPPDVLFPFERSAVSALLDLLVRREDLELKPRSIAQVFSRVLEEADLEIEGGSIEIVSADYALKVLESWSETPGEMPSE